MKNLPDSLLNSLLTAKGFDRETFIKVHESGEQVTSIRINPLKTFPHFNTAVSPVPWSQYGYYLSARPSFTFDPLFHAGCYYVQEASSMFLEQALKQAVDLSQPLKVLDCCAAPGGKSTHIQSLLSAGSLLVSNEVIRTRAAVLHDNIVKWGSANVMVTNNDPSDFSQLTGYFDVIVIDAPCSGSGLFRRDPEAIDEWSPAAVQLCAQRQQRILADVFPALKENGLLLYSTCSYSREEDEDIVNWLLKEWPVAVCPLSTDPSWQILASGGGYRFWPDRVKGEGLFMACFRKTAMQAPAILKIKNKPQTLARGEKAFVENWAATAGMQLIKHEQTVYAWPEVIAGDFSFLLNQLRVVYSGIIIGELLRDKLVPDHALAMSKKIAGAVGRLKLDYENAIQYLKRKDITVHAERKGWQLVTYEEEILGWVNVLSNRVNNYYPKELRILKDQ